MYAPAMSSKCASCGSQSGFEIANEPVAHSTVAYSAIRCRSCKTAVTFVDAFAVGKNLRDVAEMVKKLLSRV